MPTISHYAFTALGGSLGAASRIALGAILPTAILGIPLQILLINVFGCFVMGFLVKFMTLHNVISDNMRYFLVSGFLGGFTTFSAFALEFGLLFQKHEYFSAIIYALLSFFMSILFFFIGTKIIG